MAFTRTLSITYGSRTVPGSGANYSIEVVDLHQLSLDYRSLTLEFTVAIRGSGTDADFATELQSLRDDFRRPNQSLTVSIAGADQFAGTPASHTFMGAQASVTPVAAFQSAKSHGLRVSITAILPADLAGQSGRYTASVGTSQTPEGIKQVTVSASYSGLSGTSASGHQATFEAYAAAIVATVSGTFEVSSPTSVQRDDFDYSASFSISYEEIRSDQSAQGANDARLVGTRYKVETQEAAAGIAGEVLGVPGLFGSPPFRARVTFSTGVLVTATESWRTIVESVILPFLGKKLSDAGVTGVSRIMGRQVRVDLSSSRVSGSVDYLVFPNSLVFASVEVDETETTGESLAAVLNDSDKFEKDLFSGPAFRVRSVALFARELHTTSKTQIELLADQWERKSKAEGWILTSRRMKSVGVDMVLPLGSTSVSFLETAVVLQFAYRGAKKSRRKGRRPTTGNRL